MAGILQCINSHVCELRGNRRLHEAAEEDLLAEARTHGQQTPLLRVSHFKASTDSGEMQAAGHNSQAN